MFLSDVQRVFPREKLMRKKSVKFTAEYDFCGAFLSTHAESEWEVVSLSSAVFWSEIKIIKSRKKKKHFE